MHCKTRKTIKAQQIPQDHYCYRESPRSKTTNQISGTRFTPQHMAKEEDTRRNQFKYPYKQAVAALPIVGSTDGLTRDGKSKIGA